MCCAWRPRNRWSLVDFGCSRRGVGRQGLHRWVLDHTRHAAEGCVESPDSNRHASATSSRKQERRVLPRPQLPHEGSAGGHSAVHRTLHGPRRYCARSVLRFWDDRGRCGSDRPPRHSERPFSRGSSPDVEPYASLRSWRPGQRVRDSRSCATTTDRSALSDDAFRWPACEDSLDTLEYEARLSALPGGIPSMGGDGPHHRTTRYRDFLPSLSSHVAQKGPDRSRFVPRLDLVRNI